MGYYVAYYRVSTTKQGESGYGIKAQEQSIYKFLKPNDTIIAEFHEIESGTRADRPELAKALAICKEKNATLICARMDRLYRSVSLMSQLMDTGIEFIFCDFPGASRMNIQILSVLAEYEAMRISKNTKLALEQVRKHGSKSGRPIGNPNGFKKLKTAQKMGPIAKYKIYLEHPNNKMAFAFVIQLTATHKISSRAIAEALNINEYRTHLGKQWTSGDVVKLKRMFNSVNIKDKVTQFNHFKLGIEAAHIAKGTFPTLKPAYV